MNPASELDCNLNNSNEKSRNPVISWGATASIAIFFAILLVLSVDLPRQISGRLHPGVIPGTIAALGLVVTAWSVRRGSRQGPSGMSIATVNRRAMICATVAVAVLALGTRSSGVLPSVAIAGAVAAWGVAGTSLLRCISTGIGLAAVCGAVFVLVLRQPLPLLSLNLPHLP